MSTAPVISGDSSSITKPVLSHDQVRHVLSTCYGVEAVMLKEFPSYDDLNYYVLGRSQSEGQTQDQTQATSPDTKNREYVLKINNRGEDRRALDLQNKAMAHLRAK